MSPIRSAAPRGGFSLMEVILTLVIVAVAGALFFTYMGSNLSRSGNPVVLTQSEGDAERWMERIVSDYVQAMNAASYASALATIYSRNYTASPYNMPASVTLTRTYITFDGAGNRVDVTGGGTSTNLRIDVRAGGHDLTTILTAQRVTDGDPAAYY
jgi:prepilin-type N-terminal cleavage/methylation domain-containing protein